MRVFVVGRVGGRNMGNWLALLQSSLIRNKTRHFVRFTFYLTLFALYCMCYRYVFRDKAHSLLYPFGVFFRLYEQAKGHLSLVGHTLNKLHYRIGAHLIASTQQSNNIVSYNAVSKQICLSRSRVMPLMEDDPVRFPVYNKHEQVVTRWPPTSHYNVAKPLSFCDRPHTQATMDFSLSIPLLSAPIRHSCYIRHFYQYSVPYLLPFSNIAKPAARKP